MRRPRTSSRRLPARALLAGALLLAAACRDGVGAGPALPGARGVLTIAPRFQAGVEGGPTIALTRVDVSLMGGVEGLQASPAQPAAQRQVPVIVQGSGVFRGDSAVVQLPAPAVSAPELWYLYAYASDATGDTVFSAFDTITVQPPRAGAAQRRVLEQLSYVAPDAALAFMSISPIDAFVFSGDTLRLQLTGYTSGESVIENVRVGWTSRNPAVATVDANGLVTAGNVSQGFTWIVARTYLGVADSAAISVGTPGSAGRRGS